MDKMQVEKKKTEQGENMAEQKIHMWFPIVFIFLDQQYVLHCNFPTLLYRKAG